MRLILFIFSIMLAFGQNQKKDLTIDDIIKNPRASAFSISDNGAMVVWAQSRYVKDKDGFVNDLYIYETKTKKSRRLTSSDFSDSSPQFMMNDSLIVFTSNRKPVSKKMKGKGSQLWALPVYGGELYQLSDFKFGQRGVQKLNHTSLIVKLRDAESQKEKTKKKDKDDAIVIDEIKYNPSTHLYEFDLKTKKLKRLTHNADNIESWTVSKSGKYAITSHTRSGSYGYDDKVPPEYALTNLKTQERTVLFTGNPFPTYSFSFDSSESGFYFIRPFSTNPPYTSMSINELYYYDIKAGTSIKIETKFEKQMASFRLFPMKSGYLLAFANGTKNYIYKMTGKKTNVRFNKIKSKFQGHIWSVFSSPVRNEVVFGYSTLTKPMDFYMGSLSNTTFSKSQKMTRFMKSDKNYGRAEKISWKGALDETVEGILFYPKNYKKGTKYPLIVQIHGGPASADIESYSERWAYYPRYMSQHRNSFILKVNYHGSSRYGLEWVQSIRGHYYDYPFIDINNGVDYVLEQGFAHEDSLAILGWSNGAILSTDAVTKTNRYKATVPGAGDVNWFSDFGNCAFGAAFDIDYFGGVPWKDIDLYVELSPFFRMEKIKTPTLLFHGTNDRAVPTEQSWQHYRAMQQIGHTPVKFVLFPGQPHGLRRVSHQLRKIQEEIAWLDKYLYRRDEHKKKIWTKSSPLASLMSRKSVMMHEGNYGQMMNSVLLPQMSKKGDLQVSTFELTQAQYHSIMKTQLKKPLDHPNKPISGLSFDDVKTFIKTINAQTGKTYRLPTKAEMKAWIKSSKAKENNLNYWLGFRPSDRDHEQIQQDLVNVDATQLIKDVFSFGTFKSKSIYDINGNVAEFVSNGEIMGGYVLFNNTDNEQYQSPKNVALVGFRLVLDEK